MSTLKHIAIQSFQYNNGIIDRFVNHSPWSHSNSLTGPSGPTIPNIKRRLQIEYLLLDDKTFKALIVKGAPEVLGVKTNVDWNVLHKAVLEGYGVVSLAPLVIEGDFIWKNKGSVKLCYV